MIRPARRLFPAGLLAASAIAASGCGVSTDANLVRDDQRAVSARQVRDEQDVAEVARRRAALPKRPSGQLAVSMRTSDLFTARAISGLRKDDSPVTFSVRPEPTDQGFADLCAGRVDLIQSGRRITDAELAECEANGLQIGAPIQLGYATAVLVTQNGQDVGGDCLTLGGVRALLARGTKVTNWQQIGFGDHEVAVGIPPIGSAVDTVLGTVGLRRPVGTTTSADFRGDAETFKDPNRLSAFVTNQDRIAALDAATTEYEARLADQRAASFAREQRRAENAAARPVLVQIERENRARVAAKRSVADPEALEARNAQRVAAAKRTARRKVQATQRATLARAGAAYRAGRLPAAEASGRLGVVSYGFYESHSDVLRPLEIDPRLRASGTGSPDCRFPSQQTIVSGGYPLTLPLYLYGDATTIRGPSARVLIRRLLDRNASIAREQDVSGLSSSQIAAYRKTYGVPATTTTTGATGSSGSDAAGTTPTTTTPRTPSNGIPGINSPDVP
jgi:ABC-type phosphate transport system substrate-binding protein